MRYYIIAGEASGDLHGSNLIKALRRKDLGAEIHCWGGELMQQAGATLVKHYRDLAFMGFVEVLKNLRTIFRNLDFCKKDIEHYQPDTLILIDYPGFNLRIAAWAKAKGYKVIYYISPQVWAWKENRVKKMKQCIDLMLVIIPFEKDFFEKRWNWPVTYVGHPLMEAIAQYRANEASASLDSVLTQSAKPLVALLPGSRKQEILAKLPIMLEATIRFPEYQFVVAKAPGLEPGFYSELLAPYSNVASVVNQTYALLSRAKGALVTSGTATLETALFKVPEVVCYKGSKISFAIAKRILKIKFISLVNLIMDREVVKELIQDELTANNLVSELNKLLNNPDKREQLERDYKLLHQKLSNEGTASDKAATTILEYIGVQA